MATIDAYGVKFIGNDFVAPRVRQQAVRRVAAPQPQYVPQPVQEAVQEVVASAPIQQLAPATTHFSTQLTPAIRMPRNLPRLPHLFSLRTGVIAMSSAVLLAGLVVGVPHAPAAWHAVNRVGSRIALGARLDMHGTPKPSFVMPANAILVKDAELSTFVDAIESQSITITIRSKTITPGPIDIQKWVSQTTGPGRGTTVLQTNQAAITAYLTSVVQKNPNPSASFVGGDSSTAVSNATSQIAQELLKYNGTTVTLANG